MTPVEKIIAGDALRLATAEESRVRPEVERWNADPDAYVRERFHELAEWDFPVYSAGALKIQTSRGRAVSLWLNRMQRRLWQWFLEDLAAGVPIRWYIVKARQEGVSTWALALFLWLTSLHPNRNALIVAHDEASTMNFNSRVRSMYAQLPPQLRPPALTDRRDLVHFGNKTNQRQKGAGVGLDSRLVFATAQRGELGRSYNFHAVLLSEFAIWPELGIDIKDQLVALNQTIAEQPGTVVILETTAKGESEATEMWTDEENGYRKIFIPHVAFDEYRRPTKKDLGELCAADEAGDRSTRYGNEVEESRLIREALAIWYPEEIERGGEEWIEQEVVARLNWRRYTIDKKCLGDLRRFRHEYPTTATHAWSSESRSCFDVESLELMRAYVESEGIEVVSTNYLHDPEESDANQKFQVAPYGKVRFYRLPDEFPAYESPFVLGADTSMGLSAAADPSAAIVLHVSPEGLEECASFNGVIPPDEFAELIYYLAILYNKALVGAEHNESGGAVVNTVLSKFLHYPRLYYPRDPYTGKRSRKPGFVTNAINKSALVADLSQTVREHGIIFRSPVLLDQLAHYQELPNGKLGGAPGWKDDFVSAALIATFLAGKVHQFQPPPPQIKPGTFAYEARQLARAKGLRLIGV